MQHFATLAGRSPLDLPALDSLATVLAPATAEVPFYAATVARARLARFQQRLSAALTTPTCVGLAPVLGPLNPIAVLEVGVRGSVSLSSY